MINKPDFKNAINKSFSEISGDLRKIDSDGKSLLDAMNFKNQINAEIKEYQKKNNFKFLKYLKDENSILKIKKILEKGNKTTTETKKKEIKKYLKDGENLNKFLKSYYNTFSKKNKETKEAASSGSSGQFTPIFSENNKKINKTETKESTSSSSSGQYSTNKVWAKSMNKKHFRGYNKVQIPGGQFVTVKKRCKKYPYCNQGDINALKIFENKDLHEVIKKISLERNIHQEIIYEILNEEINKLNNKSIYN